jgi:hypothetical protein
VLRQRTWGKMTVLLLLSIFLIGVGVPLLAFASIGFIMPRRVAVATANATIPAPVEWVFDLVAVDRRQAFRSDLKDVEVVSDTRWTERANDSPPVSYQVIRQVSNEVFEAVFQGKGFTGRWLVRFSAAGDDATTLVIYEELQVSHPLLRPIVRLAYPLQAAVDRFVADVRDAADRGGGARVSQGLKG